MSKTEPYATLYTAIAHCEVVADCDKCYSLSKGMYCRYHHNDLNRVTEACIFRLNQLKPSKKGER